jgi:16S rRNA (guanine966-N2)-methyltransferase
MRIVGGAWRGKSLIAPQGAATRPTADRVRQSLFDMLLHSPWGGRSVIEDAVVLDAFAGTGAMGLEALSRGAASCSFIESAPAALRVLRANIAACKADERCRVIAGDVLACGPGQGVTLAFFDPPYGNDLAQRSILHLRNGGWFAPGAIIVVELGRGDSWLPTHDLLTDRTLGPARIVVYRMESPAAP